MSIWIILVVTKAIVLNHLIKKDDNNDDNDIHMDNGNDTNTNNNNNSSDNNNDNNDDNNNGRHRSRTISKSKYVINSTQDVIHGDDLEDTSQATALTANATVYKGDGTVKFYNGGKVLIPRDIMDGKPEHEVATRRCKKVLVQLQIEAVITKRKLVRKPLPGGGGSDMKYYEL